jgi:hypothetical protein
VILVVLNGKSYEDETRRLLSEAQSELKTIESKMNGLQQQSLTLLKVINAYQTVLSRIGSDDHQEVKSDWIKLLDNKINKEKLEIIAQHNNGKIAVGQVVDILFDNHLVKSQKRNNVYVIVNSALNGLIKDGKIKRIKPGEYYLVGTQQSLLKQ